ncbi:NUDIX domain-containing protein [Patescibacteria group bacterium]|nr:NUDIX domain-containing protein [Patescibacteria group bacterium]
MSLAPILFLATKAFIEYQGKVLIVRESTTYQEGVHAGKFDLPGGRMSPGEHVEDALKREIREEAGLDVEIHEPCFVNESWPMVKGEQWQIVRIFFRATAYTDSVQLSADHAEARWIDPASYLHEPIIENLIPAFEAYLRRIC